MIPTLDTDPNFAEVIFHAGHVWGKCDYRVLETSSGEVNSLLLLTLQDLMWLTRNPSDFREEVKRCIDNESISDLFPEALTT